MNRRCQRLGYGLLIIGSCLLGFSSCDPQTPKDDEFAIHFDLSNANERKVYISELTVEGEVILDSIRIEKDGSGSYIGKVEHRSMYMIKTENNLLNFVTLLPDSTEIIKVSANYDSLVETYNLWICRKVKERLAENKNLDKTSLKAIQKVNLHSMECSGFTASDLILPLQKMVRKNLILVDSLSHIWQENLYNPKADSIRLVLDSIYTQVSRQQRQLQIKLAAENTQNLVPIYAIYQLCGERMLLDFENPTDLDSISKWVERMLQTQRGNPHVDKLKMRVDRLKSMQKQNKLKMETPNSIQ
ncbi:MAG: DUF4369 domain-containing protein [Bacteroidales bacterium]